MANTQIDFKATSDWAETNIENFNRPAKYTKFNSGQSNPTYLIETSKKKYVLRKKPEGILLKSAHAVDREYRVQLALQNSPIPVPRMYAYCDDVSILGTEFYIMEHLEGVCFEDPRLDVVPKHRRYSIFEEMSNILAGIHKVDLVEVGLSDYGPGGDYFNRQITRWTKQYRSSETGQINSMNQLILWLEENVPADDGKRCLVHGDFRLDNLLFDPKKSTCVAVLDWELSTIGHPFADLASVLMQWSMPTGLEGRGLKDINRKDFGLMEDKEFVDSYCENVGLNGIYKFEFYMAFAFFRMAAILQGVKKRGLEGNASNPEKAMKLGNLVKLFSEKGIAASEKNKGF
ncbi:MAG: phosphotransferase family protein [Paracoccaceae bacterium]